MPVDQLKLQTADGTQTHNLDDSGNATHTGRVTAAEVVVSGDATVGDLNTTEPVMFVDLTWNPGSADYVGFVAPRACRVKSITARVEVAGTDGGAVTAVVKKAASGTAIASGTALHSSTINLKGTAATNQAMTVVSADAAIPAGTAIGLDVTGTMTGAVGVVTVGLALE